MNAAEKFVQDLCRKTFLSMWSLPNPRGATSGRELCDVLVVCDPDVIIISVKDIAYKRTKDVTTGLTRWQSKAIDASVKQLYGAERTLRRLTQIKTRDGTGWLYLPPVERRRVHRIAVALGSQGEVPIADGNLGQGFVHVFEEKAVLILLRELDTITDLTHFLRASEAFLESCRVVSSGLEDVLALYLHNGRSFPTDVDLLILHDDMWSGISNRDEFARRKEADRESYLWDGIIEYVLKEHDPDLAESHGDRDDPNPRLEQVARIMARESRFSRRVLAKAFKEFHQGGGIRARIVPSMSGVIYVFLAAPRDADRTLRRNELLGRMFIARGMYQESTTVVGIATEEYKPNGGFSLDVASYHKPQWTDEDQALMEEMKEQTGAFAAPKWSKIDEDEYPIP